MRKQIIQPIIPGNQNWLYLETLAQIELTSEAKDYPVEFAFSEKQDEAWKAAQSGEQKVRIVFDEPQNIKQIKLTFREMEQERTQEFLLSWLPMGVTAYQEIVRQQYSFSPPHTTQELENYTVNLEAVRALELTINPDISSAGAFASLTQLQLS